MNFRTEVEIPRPQSQFDYSSGLLTLGSCFADEIGTKLADHLFLCVSNPFGTVFNPLAIAALLDRAVEQTRFEEGEFFWHLELWRHNLVHSSLASTTLETSLENANKSLAQLRDKLAESQLLIISLGSAWVYEIQDSKEVVGHNHKRPLKDFQKRLLQPQEIASKLKTTFNRLLANSPQLKVCLTVSPVRHLKDGLHENNLSKASLLLAADRLAQSSPNIEYFPAYEILNDELRDYRFYANDLAHPSSEAVQFIWEHFLKAYLSKSDWSLFEEIRTLQNSLAHSPTHPETKANRQFHRKLLEQIESLSNRGLDTDPLLEKWNNLS
ncbi:GSCFA domain-containing protein [Pelagicoccus mobilis]|uniref:GSCFA domain-containing protein n=1 Tax=Pelagicoccus mobilis TaxID=415221 RepID=A0A934RXG9_9BACT|nr:GSCFA domain-containing protein [Pelagicoccus mobilis]MBK1877019.1 GSCFA domain-containing protein [Pelagicoccus mobilis]